MTLVKVRLSFKAFSAASFIASLLHLRQSFIYLKFTFIFIFFFWIVLVSPLPFFISHLFYRLSLLILSHFLFIFLYLVNIFLALFDEPAHCILDRRHFKKGSEIFAQDFSNLFWWEHLANFF